MCDDPWKEIPPSPSVMKVSAKRVRTDIQWDFFWASGAAGEPILFLDHTVRASLIRRLPRMRGVDLRMEDTEDQDTFRIIFRLRDLELKPVFARLCQDVIGAAGAASTEAEAVDLAVNRTWHWHYLLQGARRELLSIEEQKGLIGELSVMYRFLLPIVPVSFVVQSWTGPFGAPKDFELGSVGIEVKARRPGARPEVRVSSEHQLDNRGFPSLFLVVVDFRSMPTGSDIGFTVTQLVELVRERVSSLAPQSVELFDTALTERGFSWNHDYSDSVWELSEIEVFDVDDDFPRIVASDLSEGISDVRYSLDLNTCTPFLIDTTELELAIRRVVNVD